jgi:hypothetical protein
MPQWLVIVKFYNPELEYVSSIKHFLEFELARDLLVVLANLGRAKR